MKKSDKPIVALIYDFDGTLAPGNMQEYSFIKAIGKTVDEFWEESHRMADTQDADGILIYMLLMLDEARKKNISLTKESFMKFGRDVKFFPGVESWFKRINEIGKQEDVIVEHYINSSGLLEILEGMKIAKEFKTIFASSFYYSKKGNAIWPAAAVNYTNKTQFLFKINKGILNIHDSEKINESMEMAASLRRARRIDFPESKSSASIAPISAIFQKSNRCAGKTTFKVLAL